MKNENSCIAGIILAAGGSSRLGRPKQLIEWHGSTLIQQTIEKVEKSGIEPIIVVLGSNQEIIKNRITNYKIQILYNETWKCGKGSSISTGFRSLPISVNAAIVFVADQPYLEENLINKMVDIYEQGEFKIIAPYVGEIQTNPVLFDRSLFGELLELRDEMGGKEIIKNHPVFHLMWNDPRLLIDIDDEKDVELLIN